MKITLYQSEARSIIASKYGLPDNIDLEIIDDLNPGAHQAAELTYCFQRNGFTAKDGSGAIRMDKKIAAIKHLREVLANWGHENSLLATKTAVENWVDFLNYIHDNAMPCMGHQSQPYPWVGYKPKQ